MFNLFLVWGGGCEYEGMPMWWLLKYFILGLLGLVRFVAICNLLGPSFIFVAIFSLFFNLLCVLICSLFV
jgi:hypothetical protein